jgi:hypothetical protein
MRLSANGPSWRCAIETLDIEAGGKDAAERPHHAVSAFGRGLASATCGLYMRYAGYYVATSTTRYELVSG